MLCYIVILISTVALFISRFSLFFNFLPAINCFLVLLVYLFDIWYIYIFFNVLWWAQMESNHRPHAYQACALTSWAISPQWRWRDSNSRPPACKAGALPTELHPRRSGIHLLSHTVSSAVPSASWVLTVVFGMGTGVSPKRIDARNIVIQLWVSILITQQ